MNHGSAFHKDGRRMTLLTARRKSPILSRRCCGAPARQSMTIRLPHVREARAFLFSFPDEAASELGDHHAHRICRRHPSRAPSQEIQEVAVRGTDTSSPFPSTGKRWPAPGDTAAGTTSSPIAGETQNTSTPGRGRILGLPDGPCTSKPRRSGKVPKGIEKTEAYGTILRRPSCLHPIHAGGAGTFGRRVVLCGRRGYP